VRREQCYQTGRHGGESHGGGQVEVNRAVLGVDACRWAVGYKVRLLELILNMITFMC
jgi:hypothetical protein